MEQYIKKSAVVAEINLIHKKTMNYEKDQKYCVVATVNGVRKAISGPMTKKRAEEWCMMENEIPAYRRENKYPKVAKFPYKSYHK